MSEEFTQEEIDDTESWLRLKGWKKADNNLWEHKDCRYFCAFEKAILVQEYRDGK